MLQEKVEIGCIGRRRKRKNEATGQAEAWGFSNGWWRGGGARPKTEPW